MTGKNRQSEQEELRAATAIKIRAIILAAIVALVVSAAPFASAGTSKAKAPRVERAEQATAFIWVAELSPVVTRKPKPRGLSIGSAEVFELNTVKGRGAGRSRQPRSRRRHKHAEGSHKPRGHRAHSGRRLRGRRRSAVTRAG